MFLRVFGLCCCFFLVFCMFRAGFSVGLFPWGSWAMVPQIFGFGFWLAPSPDLFSCMCVCVCDVCVYSVLC